MLASQTLPDFQPYLPSRKPVPEKSVTFYAYWANRYLTFRPGRDLNQALAMRNKARYDGHATMGKTEAEFVLRLASEIIEALADFC